MSLALVGFCRALRWHLGAFYVLSLSKGRFILRKCVFSAHVAKEVNMDNEQRIGVVAIVVSDKNAVPQVQTVLSAHGTIIVGRMGIPDHESGKNVIALIVKGTVEQVSALSGALGRIDGASAKSLMTK